MGQTASRADTTWYDTLKGTLLAKSPYCKNPYYQRFANGTLTRE